MKISIFHLIDGARKSRDLTVIIDVFRAFSTECYVFDKGAEKILPVGNVDQAKKLSEEHPDYILIGEREEQKIEGFHFGNSPSLLLNTDFTGKTVVHTTSAGTKGIVNATGASEILTGSFVNAGAIVRYIQKKRPMTVSLVCMGYSAREKAEEDTLCAEYIYNQLKGLETDFTAIKRKIRETTGKRFFDPEKAAFNPSEDFELCMDLDRFDFIIRAEQDEKDLLVNRKIEF